MDRQYGCIMGENGKRIRVSLAFLLLLAVMLILLAGWKRNRGQEDTVLWTGDPAYDSREDSMKVDEIRKLLQGQETLIDYQFRGPLAYTLISTRGQTDYGDLFVVFEQEEMQGKPESEGQKRYIYQRVYENDFLDLKPWRLRLGDIDGDGVTDILTAVRKTTYYDTQEKNRLFAFNYIDHKMIKKWTGSQIAGTWRDFIVGELLPVKGEEIIFISEDEGGKEKLMVYSWLDFGFQALAESDGYDNISGLVITGENHIELTYYADQEKKTILTVKKGRMIKVESES